MSYYVIDVESDGPIPNMYSMVCFGAVKIIPDLRKTDTFYGQTAPISDSYKSDALAISGFSRDEHKTFDDPFKVMTEFYEWIQKTNVGQAVFFSDNPAYDWQWINYYFHFYLGKNPFGWSARRIGDIFSGYEKTLFSDWKKYRITKHSHHPVDDAMSNAEAFLKLYEYGIKMKKLK